jgi:hypothetical protein
MADEKKQSPNRVKDVAFRIAKATVKAVLIYLLYFLVAPFVMPLLSMVPGMVESIEFFVIVFVVLMILGDLTAGTVYRCFFNTARALFVIGYLVFSVRDGLFTTNFESYSLTVNLTLFYGFAALLSLVELAKTVMQAIQFMGERAETCIKP